MARITVEDSIDKVPSRFELVLIASQRARKLHTGDQPTVEKENDKNIMSDKNIVFKLKKNGINIARRTVSKYRKLMDIPSSFKRKKQISKYF